MINEDALWYKRGDLVEFKLNLGGGPRTCRGLVVNTAVLFGRGARQIWILDMDGGTPEQQAHWVNKKHIVHEEDIISRIRVVDGTAINLIHDRSCEMVGPSCSVIVRPEPLVYLRDYDLQVRRTKLIDFLTQ
jgi:hypothetical protein